MHVNTSFRRYVISIIQILFMCVFVFCYFFFAKDYFLLKTDIRIISIRFVNPFVLTRNVKYIGAWSEQFEKYEILKSCNKYKFISNVSSIK